MVQEPTSSHGRSSISELHKLIESASSQLGFLEQATSENQDESNSIQNHCDINLNVEQSIDLNSFLNKPSILRLLIKRKNQYLCSECDFESNYYQDFYRHYIKKHKSCENHLKISNSSKLLHCCTKCSFVSFNYKGFTTHCSTKHRCSTQEALQSIPLSNSKAEVYFQAYLKTADSRQRKQVVKLLRHFSNKNQKTLKSSSNHFKNDSNQEMHCSECSYKNNMVYYLEEHYQKIHDMYGPERNVIDNMFHCQKCSFSTMSYRKLHFHSMSHSENFNHNGVINEVNSEDNTFPSTVPTLGNSNNKLNESATSQESFQECKVLHCNLCEFSTESICTILNHWRSGHTREYPPFVTQHIEKAYNQNIVEIIFPATMINDRWVNGWMNQKCTNLIKKPLYCCEFCSYSTNNFKMISTHYLSHHKEVAFSSSRLNVFESSLDPDLNADGPMLCQQSSLYQCMHCRAYTSCFFKNMQDHYKSSHKELFLKLNEFDFSNELENSLVIRCMKCKDFYSEPSQILQHYNEAHSSDIITFSLETPAETEIYAVCYFCKHVCTTVSELFHHLENHCQTHLDTFDRSHVVGYCCSKCRRVFRQKRFLHFHYSRLHVEWNEFSFKYSDFPDDYFRKKVSEPEIEMKENNEISQSSSDASNSTIACSQPSTTDESLDVSTLTKSFSDESSNRDESSPALRNFSCHLCHFASNFAPEMQTHLETIHGLAISLRKVKNKFLTSKKRKVITTCSHQTYVEKNPMLYKKHIESLHNEVQPYECPNCRQFYICEVVLRMHIRKKHKFDNVSSRKENFSPNQKRIISSCTHRNIQGRNPILYQAHVAKKHCVQKPFHCPKCNRIYECQSIFVLHLRKKHGLEISEPRTRRYCRFFSEVKTTSLKTIDCRNSINNISSLESKQSKDYNTSKSVKTIDGNWKCLYCKQVLKTYTYLKRHIMKDHANCRLLRCRWCDYICRNNVQLTNHMRIHSTFVSERMKVLREICRNNRENRSIKNSKEEEKKEAGVEKTAISVDSSTNFDDGSCGSDANGTSPAPWTQVARKSIRPVASCKKVLPRVQCDRPPPQYSLTLQGTFRCKHCEFQCTEKTRMQLHLKSSHATRMVYKCKFCSYQNGLFNALESHLVLHHKMERNHREAVETSIIYDQVQVKASGNVEVDSVYTPQPSLPIDNDVIMESKASSSVVDLHSVEPVFPQRLSQTPFQCSYCSVQLPSSYDTECHMMRHERCMINNTDFSEKAVCKFIPLL